MAAGVTRTEQAYQKLRSDILKGHIEPGTQLQFARLANDYGASMGVLREALTRLSAEGLVVNEAQHGFRVMPVTLEDLIDLTATRSTIESLVFRDSIANGDLEWETRIVAAFHRMERTTKYDPHEVALVTDAWAEAHQSFHAALLSAAKSRRMASVAMSLRATAEVYRRWSMPFEIVPRDVPAEHQELVDLALARDAEGGEAALRRHLELTRDLILDGSRRPSQ